MRLTLAEMGNVCPLPDISEKAPAPKIIHYSGPDLLHHCAWCDEENDVRHIGNYTHHVCPRHLVCNLVHGGFKDSPDALLWTLLCLIAEKEGA